MLYLFAHYDNLKKSMHLKKLLFAFPLLLSAYTGHSQLIVNGGSSFTLLAGTTLTLEDGVTIQTAGTIANAGTISLKRNFVNNGVANFTFPGEIIFNGTVPQLLNSVSPLTVSHAVVDNAAGVTFNTPVTILDSLNLMNGILTAGANTPVHFGVNAINPKETSNSHIIGTAVMDSRIVGNSQLDEFLGLTIGAGVNIGNVIIIRNTGADAILNIQNNHPSIAANWTVNTTAAIPSGGREVKFSWLSNLDNGRDVTKLDIYGSKDINLFEKLNFDSAINGSVSDPRLAVLGGVNKFNRLFTLTDSIPPATSVPSVANTFTQLKVYPNPFRDVCYIQLQKTDNDPVFIYLTDLSGKVVMNEKSEAGTETTIELKNMNTLVPGIYLLHVGNENFSKNYKIVKAE